MRFNVLNWKIYAYFQCFGLCVCFHCCVQLIWLVCVWLFGSVLLVFNVTALICLVYLALKTIIRLLCCRNKFPWHISLVVWSGSRSWAISRCSCAFLWRFDCKWLRRSKVDTTVWRQDVCGICGPWHMTFTTAPVQRETS